MGDNRARYIPPRFRRHILRQDSFAGTANTHLLPDNHAPRHHRFQMSPDRLAQWRRLATLLDRGFYPLHANEQLYEEARTLLFVLKAPIGNFPCLSFRLNQQYFATSFPKHMSIFSGNQHDLVLIRAIESWYILKQCNYRSANVILGDCSTLLLRYQEEHQALCADSSF